MTLEAARVGDLARSLGEPLPDGAESGTTRVRVRMVRPALPR